MNIELKLTEPIEKNAARYFEKAKTLRKKIEGVKATIIRAQHELTALKPREEKTKITRVQREKEWYEKFRWFHSSEGFLCIGGRDATTNEIIIKKNTKPEDLVL